MVSFTLRDAGYDVIEACDGQDAFNKLKSENVDLVITDLNMPNMNGIELISAVRADPDRRFLPMVLLTTESHDDKKAKARAAGATGWIVKPFQPEQLLAVVRRVLK